MDKIRKTSITRRTRIISSRDESDTWGMGDDRVEGQIRLPSFLIEEEMAAMDHKILVSHCMNLQRTCAQLDDENKALGWEVKEMHDDLRWFARVDEIAHRLNAANLDNISDIVVNMLPQYMDCRFAAFYLYDQSRSEFVLYRSTVPLPEAQILPHDKEMGKGDFFANLFFMRDEPFLIEYIQGGYKVNSHSDYLTMFKSSDRWNELLGNSAVVFPLVTRPDEGEPLVFGGIIIGAPDNRLTEKDIEMSLMLYDILLSSVYNATLVRQLNHQATIDALTGLYNRRYLLAEMEKIIAHTMRNSLPLTMSMLDIDHFKGFNDLHGHLCGDMVLEQIGAILNNSIRKDVDIPARYGGEEFIVIMPYTNVDQAKVMSERIRQAVAEKKFEFAGKQLHVTCSIGIADYVAGESINFFIDRADAALYMAKRSGRNQVVVMPAAGRTGGS